jgi:hypothetical protein
LKPKTDRVPTDFFGFCDRLPKNRKSVFLQSLDPNYEKFKKSFKKVHRISLHTVICPSIFEGENFGEILGGLFLKDFLIFS